MNHKNAKKMSNYSFSWEICISILLQSSADLYWDNGVLTHKYSIVKDSNADLTVGNWESKIDP